MRLKRITCLQLLGLATITLVPGCSLLHPHKAPPPAPVAVAPAPPPEPVIPLGTDTHKFQIPAGDDDVVGVVQVVQASKEDTLPDIARRFNVGYEEIVRANPGVDPWVPGAGRKIVVPSQFILPDVPRTGIVINIAAMRLFYFPPHTKGKPAEVYTHPIGIGKVGWSTPQGVTSIVTRVKDPTWRPSLALRKDHEKDSGEALPAVVAPGPDNPLGRFMFTLGWPSYRIHGTNKPYGVGMRSSHGCIRLYPEDIEKLFAMVPVGTQVRVINQPYVFGWHDGNLYLQAYTVLEDDGRKWAQAGNKQFNALLSQRLRDDLAHVALKIDWPGVGTVTKHPLGLPMPVTGTVPSSDALIAAAPVVQNRVPEGANWNGVDDTNSDIAGGQQLLKEREPVATGTAAAGPAAAPSTVH